MDYISNWFRRLFSREPLGRRGERAAERYLKRRGYKIIGRGSRSKWGELDLIAVDGKTVVFVEVKTRNDSTAGHPADSVDAAKQRKLTRLAVAFLKRHKLLEYPARFDVVAITWPSGARRPTIEHICNAFDAVGYQEWFS